MKRFVLFHEIRLFGLVALLTVAAVVFAGCHHASSAAAHANHSGATSAAVAEGSNPANLPPLNAKTKPGTQAQGGANQASQHGNDASSGSAPH